MRQLFSPAKLPLGAVVAISLGSTILVLLFWRYWVGNEVTFSSFATATFIGLANGSLYAMYATGLVVVYKTTGIFNFAQGAIGVFNAFLFWELHVNRGWHSLLTLGLIVLALAPLQGVLLDAAIMRRLRQTLPIMQLVATVALMVLILAITGKIWEQDKIRRVDFFFGKDARVESIFGYDLPLNLSYHRLITIAVAIALALFLSYFLYRTRLGTAMRAVVDNRSLASLNGIQPNLISSMAWALGSSLAALGGILIAPEIALDPTNLNILIVTAFAAATFGALNNLPLTIIGSLLIGLLEQHTRTWLDFGNDFRFVPKAVAPALLFLVVIALPKAQLSVGRVVSNLKPKERLTRPAEAAIGVTLLFVAVLALSKGWLPGWLTFGWDPGEWGSAPLNSAMVAMSFAVIGLSIVPLTGWAGQINFAPLAFAGFGAFLYLKFAGAGQETTNGWWIFLVALVCAPMGALIAIPFSRLQGLYLALGSLAFAQGMSLLFFPHSAILPTNIGSGHFGDIRFNFGLFEITFDTRQTFLLLVVGTFGAIVLGLVVLRRSRYGRRWVAMNDSQAASATVGIGVNRTKVIVYALSAAIAGVGGVLWGTASVTIDGVRGFDIINGLNIVLLVVAAGVSIPMAGIFLVFIPVFENLSHRLEDVSHMGWLVWFMQEISVPLGPGFLALGMAFNPRGAIYEMGRGFAPMLPWRQDAREEKAREKAHKAELKQAAKEKAHGTAVEFGELGASRPFAGDAVTSLDRVLQITDQVTPESGYAQEQDVAGETISAAERPTGAAP